MLWRTLLIAGDEPLARVALGRASSGLMVHFEAVPEDSRDRFLAIPFHRDLVDAARRAGFELHVATPIAAGRPGADAEESCAMISVRFLGTGGARFVVAKQIRASGGLWFRFAPDEGDEPGPVTQIHVDPGPGALVRAVSCVPPCDPAELDALALSHKHLDHAGDINVMIEAMTSGGFRKRGMVLAPRDAFEGEHVIFPYAVKFVGSTQIIEERSGPYHVNDVEMRTSIKHIHGVETYGMHFRYRGTTVSYLPCGRFFEGLAEDYAAHHPDVLILNVLRYRDTMKVDHMNLEEARSVFATVRPKVGVMTHFSTKMLEQRPERLAQDIEDGLGIRMFAAYDGWTLDVATEVAAATVA